MKIALVFLIIITAVLCYGVPNAEREAKAGDIASALIDSLKLDSPVILDIRCGEWTSVIEQQLRRQLLLRGIDVRETNIMLVKDNNDMLSLAMESDFGVNGRMLLQMLNLTTADILEVSLEQSLVTQEKRGFLSYMRYNATAYRFSLKQISLPEQRLLAIKEYNQTGKAEPEYPGSLLTLKWYEPIIASAILGSLVYMLWTIK